MTKKAKDLEFISKIKSDGKGVCIISEIQNNDLQNPKFIEKYKLNPLSLSEETFIASGFNSYVVKLKQ